MTFPRLLFSPSILYCYQHLSKIKRSDFGTCIIAYNQMIKSVLVSRLTDGLPLCESNEGYADEQVLTVKHKVKRYLTEVAQYSRKDQNSLRCIENPQFAVFYRLHNHVAFTLIADKTYPPKLAGAFLESLISPFFDQVRTHFTAASYESKLETLTSELYFIKFDRKIKEKKRQFEDPASATNVERMKRELESIHEIMKQNMSLLEGRQEGLQQTSEKARRISEESKLFDDRSRKLVWQYWFKKNMVWLILALIALFVYFLI